jgi:multiple antibiotic resistance protein
LISAKEGVLNDGLKRVLGETGTMVIIRLASFLLLCIGIQIVWNGTAELLSTISLRGS